jgi:serine/threonine protein kinase
MEVMAYLHANNIYYGDMKPENLLLFKDYRIKLGDFGVSMKIPDDAIESTTLCLKGLTPKYSMPDLEAKYKTDTPITINKLLMNDGYSLMRTF